MANPIPCAMCLEVPDADFLVSNRGDIPWPFEQTTVGLCLLCFIRAGQALGEALQAAMVDQQANPEPGVLAQVEVDEGRVTPAPVESKRAARKKTDPDTDADSTPLPEEAEAAHVDS